MLKLEFTQPRKRPFRLLCLGAHSDDIEIGCGGTILRMLKENDEAEVYWVVFSADGQRAKEAKKSAYLFLANANDKTVIIEKFKESFFPYIGAQIKEYFEKIKLAFEPDVIFTHYRNDLHQDHRLISELTWNTFRDHFILEYEIIKYDGDLGTPNCFVHLDERICQKKIENIRNSFKSQASRSWFSEDTFLSIMRVRGVESNAPSRYAEGFYSRKMVIY